MLSGASSATHTALVVARDQCRKRTGAALEQMVAYASSQAHSSIEKGARIAGYDHIRLLDTGPDFAVRPATLAAAIASDRRAGLEPAFLCSALGTTGTTGVDPMRALGEIAKSAKLWHHVDAAHAGSAMICEEFRHHPDGLELVDSYTFNPHKWLATNVGCSVMWVADRRPPDRHAERAPALPPQRGVRLRRGHRLPGLASAAEPPLQVAEPVVRAEILRRGGAAQHDPVPCGVGPDAGGAHRQPSESGAHGTGALRHGAVRPPRRQLGHRRPDRHHQLRRSLLRHRIGNQRGAATFASRWARSGRPGPTSKPCGS